ncbi:succinate dehydrogenase, hydrophobic membrane anchor protein [Alsobacter sp. SYSU M60028]|uniref:Succinate dehydrogenase hydrophobic membrane anchor subunit n=1 Tax=Alsobacter ponti TaxID=2962936 RepID=A0ABT1LI01_9HYPH|nr:succinate dehydrogenase, hydrophobic membrane anchor protein [Alsobacter ponti]MCP8940508.1 succinate dehydrogenase, hydrophobic membrane anchor protein [Alsobacter ponti]
MAELHNRIETPLKRVRGLGSARSGTEHFWRQRLTAIAQIPLTIAFVVLVLKTLGGGYDALAATLANPLWAVLMLLFVVTGVMHMRIGMQVIIEDYAHEEGPKFAWLILNNFFAILVGLACVVAILKLSFGA